MCGIAISITSDKDFKKQFVESATQLLKHRGPDDDGFFVDEQVAMVHTRLSIQDLSPAGHQPMFSKSGRYVIVFNGEIYNHLELRAKFLPHVEFNTNNDTSTILELFELMGEDMLKHLVGMWAMAIYDLNDKKLFLSRDRFGQKPLYYIKTKTNLVFASEMKCLFPFAENLSFNENMVGEFLGMGNYSHLNEQTFYKEISHFPSASYSTLLTTQLQSSLEIYSYWELPKFGRKIFNKNNLLELRSLVIDAVLSQTISDRPIGITLSGGLDSSIIASILLKFHKGHIHIFTAQTNDKVFSEKVYVEALLKQYDSSKYTLHEIDLDQELIMNKVIEALNCQEEPFGDPSIVAHLMIMEKAKELAIPVIINGQGADELFWGYNNLVLALLAKEIRSFRFKSLKNWMSDFGKKDQIRVLMLAFFPSIEKSMRKSQRKMQKSELPELWKGEKLDNIIDYSDMNALWNDTAYGIHLPHLVHYDDRNAMYFGIEGRSPFLDHRLWEFVAKFNPTMNLFNSFRKGWLREAFKDLLPTTIYERRNKIGFFTPLAGFCISNYNQMIEIQKETINEFGLTAVPKDDLHLPLKNRYFFRITLISYVSKHFIRKNN